MAIYDPKSLKAEEFINDGEILDTLAYAEANKHNAALIEEILEKARPKKADNDEQPDHSSPDSPLLTRFHTAPPL